MATRKKAAVKKTATAKSPAKKDAQIEVSLADQKTITLHLQSIDPLLPHRFAQKAKIEMLDKQMGRTVGKKPPKKPVTDAVQSLYFCDGPNPEVPDGLDESRGTDEYLEPMELDFLEGRQLGVPAPMFKCALIRAGGNAGFQMTKLKAAIQVRADNSWPIKGLIPVHITEEGVLPTMRCDYARLKSGMSSTTDLRFRTEIPQWEADVEVTYDSLMISETQLLTLFHKAGQTVGIGDWRAERNGNFGTFKVTSFSRHIESETPDIPCVPLDKTA